MHIESITLKNFKKFTSKTIKFHQGLSLLVGGNNEGKSTILHALAVWEFCKTFLVINKGQGALQDMQHIDGVGLNIDEFTPSISRTLSICGQTLNLEVDTIYPLDVTGKLITNPNILKSVLH